DGLRAIEVRRHVAGGSIEGNDLPAVKVEEQPGVETTFLVPAAQGHAVVIEFAAGGRGVRGVEVVAAPVIPAAADVCPPGTLNHPGIEPHVDVCVAAVGGIELGDTIL